MNSRGIYRLQCKTCNKSYVGQTGRTFGIRHLEHIRYIKINNPISAYTLHILNNRHECGSPEHTMQLLKACGKGKIRKCWESFYILVLLQQNLLIDDHKTNEPNPLYAVAKIAKHVTQLDIHSDSARTGQAQQQHQHTGESIIKKIYFTHPRYNNYTFINKVHIYYTSYIRRTHILHKNCNNNDFTTFYFKLGNFKDFIMRFINLNCITNTCNWYTYVTWRGNEYKIPEDDTVVSKHVEAG